MRQHVLRGFMAAAFTLPVDAAVLSSCEQSVQRHVMVSVDDICILCSK